MKDLSHTNFHFHRFRYQQASPVAFVQIADHPFESSMVLMEPQKMARIYEAEGFAAKPLMHLKTNEAILDLVMKIRDAVDLKIVQTIIRDRDATQAEIAAAVGMTQPAISARLKRMRL